MMRIWRGLLLGGTLCLLGPGTAAAAEPATPQASTGEPAVGAAAVPDRSGQERRGIAAVIAPRLNGRRMADGGRFEPASDSAASNTLPLGTTARVTNLRNGRVAMVRVRDRSAEGSGRILHVSSKVAQFLGMGSNGLASVAVAPLAVPQPDGSRRLGQGTGVPGRRAAPAAGGG